MSFTPRLRLNFVPLQQIKNFAPEVKEEPDQIEDSPQGSQSQCCDNNTVSSKTVLDFMELNAIQNFETVSADDSSTNTITYTYDELKSKGYSDEVINLCFDKNGDNYTLKEEYNADLKDIPTTYTEGDNRMSNLLTTVMNAVTPYAQQAQIPRDKVEEMVNKSVYEDVNKAKNGEDVMVPDIINKILDAMKNAEGDINATTFSYGELRQFYEYSDEVINLCFENNDGVYTLKPDCTVDFNNIDKDKIYSTVLNYTKSYAQRAMIPKDDLPGIINNTIEDYLKEHPDGKSTMIPDIINKVLGVLSEAQNYSPHETYTYDELKAQGYNDNTINKCFTVTANTNQLALYEEFRETLLITMDDLKDPWTLSESLDNIRNLMTNIVGDYLKEHGFGNSSEFIENLNIERFINFTLYKAFASGENINVLQLINNIFNENDFSDFLTQPQTIKESYTDTELKILGWDDAIHGVFGSRNGIIGMGGVYGTTIGNSTANKYNISYISQGIEQHNAAYDCILEKMKAANPGKFDYTTRTYIRYTDDQIKGAINTAIQRLMVDYRQNGTDYNIVEIYLAAMQILEE